MTRSEITAARSPLQAHCVLKVGGSLLGLPGLATIIRRVIGQRPDRGSLIVAGGGAVVDAVRDWDHKHNLGQETSHRMALEAMRVNESLLLHLLPESRTVRNVRQAEAAIEDGAVGLICADCFVRWGESAGYPPLNRHWHVTSDSIAAWIAALFGSDELVLLKSVPLSAALSFEQASQAGFVDPEFPAWAQRVRRIGWVDCRAAEPVVQEWRS